MFLGQEIAFWIAVSISTVVKLVLSEHHNFWRSLITVGVGVWAAWTFTEPFIAFVGWENDTYLVAVASTFTVMGDNLARFFINASSDDIARFIRKIVGRNGS